MDLTSIDVPQLAKMIDHSLLRPELTTDEVLRGCALAASYDVASVCVRPADVALAAKALAGTGVAVGTVIGFPHGGSTTAVKVHEAEVALSQGAAELDMVLTIGLLRSGDDRAVGQDIEAVVEVAAGAGPVKVIFENAYLTDEEKIRACRLSALAGADFVKTSTGFAPGGATLEDVRLMRANTPAHMKVKAAGGVRTLDRMLEFVAAGAERFGATTTATILDDLAARRAAA
ncbi:deoxyribose-phosphate aldolase [Kitasatospora aureofaciens]|uniref:deoxyribose-phosphate aldolase n=1 Tax=Kitasatospora aureofaciens TaxID=1894 RepID=UPI001C4823B2|nr:deoxyribose-phosphate aldolase [Kitasatospora aureofaciens]MBV6700155.1 deoxyribose-phosphate aldolase [Kitasatospora aureofaciens]